MCSYFRMAENPLDNVLNNMKLHAAWLHQLVREHKDTVVYVRHREFRPAWNNEPLNSSHVRTHWIRVNGNERELALYMAFLDIVDTRCEIDKDVCEPENIVQKLIQLSPYGVHFWKEKFNLSSFFEWPIEECHSHPDVTWEQYTRKFREKLKESNHIWWM